MMQLAFHRDPRSRRTQAAILEAFVRLLAERRYDAVTVADLVAAARVGKATFYEHYRGKHDVLLAAMEPILLALSTAASGRAARSYVKGVVAHLWDRRATARGPQRAAKEEDRGKQCQPDKPGCGAKKRPEQVVQRHACQTPW